jgi:Holliday junction resolvase
MSRKSRDKRLRSERALVRYLQERGFAAERVPLGGAARGRFGGEMSACRSSASIVAWR